MKDGSLHWKNRNLAGQTFGALVALHPTQSNGKKMRWAYRCQCGRIVEKVGADVTKELKRGGTPNCGCLSKQLVSKANSRHGMSKHPTYAVWRSMHDRCRLPTHKAYPNYGGRGIQVCEAWATFEGFWQDMGATYRPGLTLERRDNNAGYSKENCLWATYRTQARNRRNSLRVDIPTVSKRTGIPKSTLYYRLRNGLSMTSSTADPEQGSWLWEPPGRS